jgi:hypothetical protein
LSSEYHEFLERKSQIGGKFGFDPVFMPDFLFDFQKYLVEWKLKKGRGGIFADCGLGKTPISLVIAENIVRKTNKNVLILTPLAVSYQFVEEGEKFGIEVKRSIDGKPKGKITVTNYEKLHLFNHNDYGEVICDESSRLKHFGGATQKLVTRFLSKMPYRTLSTATAAPNDFYELGTSAEALGELGFVDMITRFFNQTNKNYYHRIARCKLYQDAKDETNLLSKEAYRAAQQWGNYILKPHAEIPFWKWVCSWAIACRMPSDLGFENNGFILPGITKFDHMVKPGSPPDGYLFNPEVFGLDAERQERKRTLKERCELVAKLADTGDFVFIGCHYNSEGDLLEKIIPDSVQVAGKHTDEQKEERLLAFAKGQIRVLITKPKIGAWGLNYQHCNHLITFATHSYEQYYQLIRRCWRFGQKRPVRVDLISTEGEQNLRDNMQRKSDAADKIFTELVKYMNEATWLDRSKYEKEVIIPSWLSNSRN